MTDGLLLPESSAPLVTWLFSVDDRPGRALRNDEPLDGWGSDSRATLATPASRAPIGLLFPQASFNRATLGMLLDTLSETLAEGLGGSVGVGLIEDAVDGGAMASSAVGVTGSNGGEKCRGSELGGVRGRTIPVGGDTSSGDLSFSIG